MRPHQPKRPAWDIVEARGSVGDLHARPSPDDGRRRATFCWPEDSAVVLGSTQPAADVDERRCAEAGLSVVRRRSGGGAVLIEPDAQLWVDFDMGTGDVLFERDVSESFSWVGELWAGAIGAARPDLSPLEVARPRRSPPRTRYGTVLCFAAVGPGEVLSAGRKLVGLSQRRDRHGARFHTMVLRRDRSEILAGMLSRSPDEQQAAADELRATSGVIGGGGDVTRALISALTSLLP